MVERTTTTESIRPPGILEHLSDGMSLVLDFPRLLVLPILIDLYLLLGLRISSESLTTRLGEWFIGRGGQASVDTGEWIKDLGGWDASRLTAVLMPSVIDGAEQDGLFRPFDRLAWEPTSLAVLVVAVALALVGTGLFTTFMTMLATRARMIRTRPLPTAQLILDRWIKLLGFVALLIAAVASLSALLLIPGAVLSTEGLSAETVVGVLSTVGLAVLVLTMFVPEAIVIDGAGPITALRSSATVVIRFFWQSAAFFVVSLMISPGLISIWDRIAGDPVGLAVAVALNALMVTSLALASLAFYRARFDGVAPLQHSI